MSVVSKVDSLASRLNYEPQILGFGTSWIAAGKVR